MITIYVCSLLLGLFKRYITSWLKPGSAINHEHQIFAPGVANALFMAGRDGHHVAGAKLECFIGSVVHLSAADLDQIGLAGAFERVQLGHHARLNTATRDGKAGAGRVVQHLLDMATLTREELGAIIAGDFCQHGASFRFGDCAALKSGVKLRMDDKMLIVKNALLVSCDRNHLVLSDAGVIIRDGRFDWIGPSAELPECDGEVIDAAGAILMPGLINMHAHCGDALFRGLVEDKPLEAWLQNVWKAEAAILPDADLCRLGVELGIAELIMGGVSCVMDMFWHEELGFDSAQKAGIRWAGGGIFFDGPGMDGMGPEQRLERARALFDSGNEFCGVMPHGTYTVGPETLRAALTLTRERGGFFCTHAAETRAEQETIAAQYGTSVIRHLHALGALGPDVVLAHCVHVDAQEIALMGESGTHIALNPMSNLKLASGIAPVPAMQAAGINLTLGTDGPISGNDMDMFLAMRLTATLHKAVSGDAAAVNAREVLHMATLNGARALGAEARLGSVELGKEADFILLEVTAPHAAPIFDAIDHIVYAASKADVRDVYVGGRAVMRRREVLGLDVAALVARVRAMAPRIRASLEGR